MEVIFLLSTFPSLLLTNMVGSVNDTKKKESLMSLVLKGHDDSSTLSSTLHVSEFRLFISSWLSIFPKENSFSFTSKLSLPPFSILVVDIAMYSVG